MKNISLLQAAHFPQLLSIISDAPTLLYYRGDISLLESTRLLAMVGSRKCTEYGKAIVRDAMPTLVGAGVVTVSGLALGIDGHVHRETLAAGGKTIAVLGSPVDPLEVYPRRHQRLCEDIIAAGGLVVSEFASGHPTYPANFPQRNRIIAALSHATLIVQAAHGSGSLITASLALEYNREVFAVPGSVYEQQCGGTNWLISEGAQPLLSATQLCTHMGWKITANQSTLPLLTNDEQKIIETLATAPHTVNELSRAIQLPLPHIMQLLTQLQINNAVTRQGNGAFCVRQ